MHTILLFLASLTLSTSPPQSVPDSSTIQEAEYAGYIMPVIHTQAKYDPANIYFTPTRDEVALAEKMLASYLDIFCRLNNGWKDLALSPADSARYRTLFTTHFKSYFRQYAAYVPKNGTHKFVSINLVSPEFQSRLNDQNTWLRNNWAEIDDGGAILFHAEIDLTTGDVFLRDNGSG